MEVLKLTTEIDDKGQLKIDLPTNLVIEIADDLNERNFEERPLFQVSGNF